MRLRAIRIISVLLTMAGGLSHAEDFDDISASAVAMFTGNTFHGYAEMRVTVENKSSFKTHEVTLRYPDRTWNNGNSLRSVTRTVTLVPGAREIVPLLQPPLPASGDGQIRILIDNHNAGAIRAPNANSHCNPYGGVTTVPVVLVSRTLDFDSVAKTFNSGRVPEAASGGSSWAAKNVVGTPVTNQVKFWMPAFHSGGANWLETEHAALIANKVDVYRSRSAGNPTGDVKLIGLSNNIIGVYPMTTGKMTPFGRGSTLAVSFPATREPVHKVLLEFSGTHPNNIGIIGVKISGPGGASSFATNATASSEYTSGPIGTPTHGGSNPDAIISLRAELPTAEWSSEWLAYTPFDAVVLGPSDLTALPSGVTTALQNYLETGGTLVLFGAENVSASFRSSWSVPAGEGEDFKVGFGDCFAFSESGPTLLAPGSFDKVLRATMGTGHYFQALPRDGRSLNNLLPLIKNFRMPLRACVIIMLLFVLIIGPVNLFILNRMKRRTWMLWTIPAISLTTTLLVFIFSLVREGITPDTRITGLTFLDQMRHRAATIGGTAFYCPLTPSDGLKFDFDTDVTALVPMGWNGDGNARDMDWTQGQNLRRGWVSAREPEYFHLRKSEPRHERVQIEHGREALEVVNSLGAPIRELWYVDNQTNVYKASNINTGQRGLLAPAKWPGHSASNGRDPSRLLANVSFLANNVILPNLAADFLTPNTYLATLDGNPFIENALGAASAPARTKTAALVFGKLDPTDLK